MPIRLPDTRWDDRLLDLPIEPDMARLADWVTEDAEPSPTDRNLTAAIRAALTPGEPATPEDFGYAGLIVKAASGRVLLTQRFNDPNDKPGSRGRWEFPGGHIDPGEDPLTAALREFGEETGLTLPEHQVVGHLATGEYCAFVVNVDSEDWTVGAELLDKETIGIGWFDPDDLDGAPFTRAEMGDTDWGSIRTAAFRWALVAAYDESKVTRWPKGTKIHQEGEGTGGGRFRPKDDTVSGGRLIVTEENFRAAQARLLREVQRLQNAKTPEEKARAEYEIAYWTRKAEKLRKLLDEGKGVTPPPKPEPTPKPEPKPVAGKDPKFGEKIRAAIEAEPALAVLTQEEFIAAGDKLRQRELNQNRVALEDLADTPNKWDRQKYIPIAMGYLPPGTPAQIAQQALADDLMGRLDSPGYLKSVMDGSLVVKDDIDAEIVEAWQKHQADPTGGRGAIGNDVVLATGKLDAGGGREMEGYVRFGFKPVRPVRATRERFLSAAGADPAAVEQASTRVGGMIRDEIRARVAVGTEAKLDRWKADREAITAQLKAAESGLHPDSLFVWGGKLIDSTFERNHPEQFRAIQKIVDDAIADGGVNPLSSSNEKMARSNAEAGARKDAYLEVMAEIRPMGGKIDGTPANRKPKRGLSSNEQVTRMARYYPTDLINASNSHTAMNFRATSGRAHYRHSDSQITLDGTVTTAIHEFGHRVERTTPGVLELEKAFYDRRTAGETLRPLGAGYSRSERSRPDQFFSAYSGKDYEGQAYELLSMGAEAVTGAGQSRNPEYAKIDEDYEAFVLGILATTHRQGGRRVQ